MRIPCGAKWFKRAQNPTQEVRRCTIPEKGGCSMTGIYQHTLDAKGRLFIPAKLREELGETFLCDDLAREVPVCLQSGKLG